MARLKGNTYIDGDLYVAGEIKGKIGAETTLPNYSKEFLLETDTTISNRLIKATPTGLTISNIDETINGNETTYTFEHVDTEDVSINNVGDISVTVGNNKDVVFTARRIYTSRNDTGNSRHIGSFHLEDADTDFPTTIIGPVIKDQD